MKRSAFLRCPVEAPTAKSAGDDGECDDHPAKFDERVGRTVSLPSLDSARTINLRKSVAYVPRIA
jgi:hypothetical protein